MCVDEINAHYKIVIFGYADLGKELYKKFITEGLKKNEIAFCDNSTDKRNNGEYIVFSLKDVKNYIDEGTIFYTASLYHSKQMFEQLVRNGIRETNIVVDIPIEIKQEVAMRECISRFTPKKELRYEVAIVRHCNLNCKGCDHFSPLASERYMSLGEYERDVRRLSDLFDKRAEYITLLGGEPLLHPEIANFLQLTKVYFPTTELRVATNGILLASMNDCFWNACRMYNVVILLTEYPIKIDYVRLGRLLSDKNIRYGYLGSSEGGRSLWHYPLDLLGTQIANESFKYCRNANVCHTLENGRMYTCSIAPFIDDFNKYYETDLNLSDEDGIDIHQAGLTGERLLKRLAEPMPFCRYCDVKNRTYDHLWELSKKDIKEWII